MLLIITIAHSMLHAFECLYRENKQTCGQINLSMNPRKVFCLNNKIQTKAEVRSWERTLSFWYSLANARGYVLINEGGGSLLDGYNLNRKDTLDSNSSAWEELCYYPWKHDWGDEQSGK